MRNWYAEWRSRLRAGRSSAPELKHLATGGRRCALLSGRRISWVAELAVSKCDLAWFCTGRRMLSLFGYSLLCGLGVCKVTTNGGASACNRFASDALGDADLEGEGGDHRF